MIGNDLIDLIQSRRDSNWQRKGFLEKIFTAEEQMLIKKDGNPEIMVWMLWSMKEAAYKIYNRKTKIREYIPKKLQCTLHVQNTKFIFGQVNCGEDIYFTKTIVSRESIHTIAVATFEHLNHVVEIKNSNIIKDQNGIPYLINISKTPQDISLSHHGRFKKTVGISLFKTGRDFMYNLPNN